MTADVRPLMADVSEDRKQAMATTIDRGLRTHLSECFGGMFGDWLNRGLIPDVPLNAWASMTVEAWSDWQRKVRA